MVTYDSRRESDNHRYSRVRRDQSPPRRRTSADRNRSYIRRHAAPNVVAPAIPTASPVDRENTCPMLIRVFFTENKQLNIEDLNKNQFPEEEFHIYTWKDATLRELTNLIRDQIPKARARRAYFDITAYFPDFRRNSWSSKRLGSSAVGFSQNNDTFTLKSRRFQVGDIIHVDIVTPKYSSKRI